MTTMQRVYKFGGGVASPDVTEGDASMNYILGGKGANLAEMCRIGLPVPPGFTITCQTCVEYDEAGNNWPDGALDEIEAATRDLEARMGKLLGDAEDPLLVSVRSGAPFPMPGMMDTVLNLGLNDESVMASSPRPITLTSRGIRIAGSSRCSPTWYWVSMPTCSRTPSPSGA